MTTVSHPLDIVCGHILQNLNAGMDSAVMRVTLNQYRIIAVPKQWKTDDPRWARVRKSDCINASLEGIKTLLLDALMISDRECSLLYGQSVSQMLIRRYGIEQPKKQVITDD